MAAVGVKGLNCLHTGRPERTDWRQVAPIKVNFGTMHCMSFAVTLPLSGQAPGVRNSVRALVRNRDNWTLCECRGNGHG